MDEEAIQRCVFLHLRTRAVPRTIAFHPKNSGSDMRGRRRGIHVGLGVMPGVPDVIIISHGRVFGLELKRDKGKLADIQKASQAALEAAGCVCATTWGLDAAIAQLEAWGILRGVAA